MKIMNVVFRVFAGVVIFAGFLTASSEFSRSQSEKAGIYTGWNASNEIHPAARIPIRPLHFAVPEFTAGKMRPVIEKEPVQKFKMQASMTKPAQPKKISVEEKPKQKAAKLMNPLSRPMRKFSPLALLDHTELQAMTGYLDYEIIPGKGVRFRYSELLHDRMGHLWFLEKPHDLRGKTVRIDYRGYVPGEMTFRISKSSSSAALTQKVKLADASFGIRSLFIEIPDRVPFKDVGFFQFWIERETAGKTYGDFMIERVVVLESREKAGMQAAAPEEFRPEPFPFERPFIPTNLMRTEGRAS